MSEPVLDVRSGDEHGPTRIEILPPEPGGVLCVVNAYAQCAGRSWTLRVSADVSLSVLADWVHAAEEARR